MVCTFYHSGLKSCCVSYCYYPRNNTIDCPVKKIHIAEVGEIFRESPDSVNQPLATQMQTRRYPKQY